MKIKSKKNKTFSILKKAWNIQSKSLRRFECCGCGSETRIIAGHLVHGGKGKAWNLVDFNACLPNGIINVFSQCCECNTFNPDGNALLYIYFKKLYRENALENYNLIKSYRQKVWRPTEEEAKKVLEKTIELYGSNIDF